MAKKSWTIDEVAKLLVNQMGAAEILGISKQAVSIRIAKNEIPHARIGREILMLRSDVEAFAQVRRGPGRPPRED